MLLFVLLIAVNAFPYTKEQSDRIAKRVADLSVELSKTGGEVKQQKAEIDDLLNHVSKGEVDFEAGNYQVEVNGKHIPDMLVQKVAEKKAPCGDKLVNLEEMYGIKAEKKAEKKATKPAKKATKPAKKAKKTVKKAKKAAKKAEKKAAKKLAVEKKAKKAAKKVGVQCKGVTLEEKARKAADHVYRAEMKKSYKKVKALAKKEKAEGKKRKHASKVIALAQKTQNTLDQAKMRAKAKAQAEYKRVMSGKVRTVHVQEVKPLPARFAYPLKGHYAKAQKIIEEAARREVLSKTLA